jgi:hypothetical protein
VPTDDRRRRFSLTPPNPLRSEAGAFGFLIWFVCLVALILLIVVVLEAL